MDFFNKAKEAAEKYAGGGDSSSSKTNDKKDSDSIFTKAMGAVEKYHVKEKAVEYAQKQVAKREEEKHQPGYVEKKDKSVVDKAKEAAEDFLAKQVDKPEEGQTKSKDDTKSESRSRSSSSSDSSSDEEREKDSRNLENNSSNVNPTIPAGGASYYPTDVDRSYSGYNNPGYSGTGGEGDINGSFSRLNLDNKDSSSASSRYETYQEYWSRQGDAEGTERHPRYTGDPVHPSDSRRQSNFNASSPYSSRGEGGSAYDGYERSIPSYAGASSRDNNPSVSNEGDRYGVFGGTAGSRDSYPSGSDSGRYQSSEEYYRRSGGGDMNNDGRNYPNYSSGATTASVGYDEMGGMSSGVYGTRVPGSSSGAGMPYGSYSGYTSTDHV